eukprot:m51a1_g9081 hypothetical protein (260) ;mRNA; f:25548-27323
MGFERSVARLCATLKRVLLATTLAAVLLIAIALVVSPSPGEDLGTLEAVVRTVEIECVACPGGTFSLALPAGVTPQSLASALAVGLAQSTPGRLVGYLVGSELIALYLCCLLVVVVLASRSPSPLGAEAEEVHALAIECAECSGGRLVVNVPASTTPHDLAVLAQAEAEKQGVSVPARLLLPADAADVGELVRMSGDLSLPDGQTATIEFDTFSVCEKASLVVAAVLSRAGMSRQTASHVATAATVTFFSGYFLYKMWE